MIRNRWGVAWPRVKTFVQNIRNHEGSNLPIGAAGFCWGGKHAVTLAHRGVAADGKPLVDASFIAHPSLVAVPGDIDLLGKPLSVAIGDKDFVVSETATESMRQSLEKVDVESEFRIYPGAGHGFAVRADPMNEKVMEQSKEAEEQAMAWFGKQFAKRSP